ncbi:MAG: VWA domain-containing protein [Alphaproteobacteria bacterium]|nr:VWA domain-containing protein [Alphaproteobacteria bacterium]MCB9699592.1 VWA domain-containing protein [Alphaproteobacteria bacterium]
MWWCIIGLALAGGDDDERMKAVDFEFAADVLAGSFGATPGGAQDITYFRDQVAAGAVPLPEVFTPEGLFSEHDLPLVPSRPCERLLCAELRATEARLTAQPDARWLAQVGFTSGLTEATFHRPPVSLVAVIDKSCSMSGEPIDTVKRSLVAMIDQLGPEDQLAIVAYGSDVATVLPPTSATDRQALREAVERVAIDGSTNLEAGLTRGYELARAARRSFDGVSRVVLFTDERPNTGRTDAASFMGMAEAASRDHVGTTTIGVGTQFGAELAQQVSSVRGGNLFFFSDLGAMREKVASDFAMMFTELAYDLDLVVSPKPGMKVAGVYGVPGDAVRWTEGGALQLHVSTVFLSRDDGAIYVAFAPDGPMPASGRPELGAISLSYDPRDGERSTATSTVRSGPLADGDVGLRRGRLLVDEVTTLERATALHHHDNDQEGAWQDVHGLLQRLVAAGDPALSKEIELVTALDATLAQLAGRSGEVPVSGGGRDPVTGLPTVR